MFDYSAPDSRPSMPSEPSPDPHQRVSTFLPFLAQVDEIEGIRSRFTPLQELVFVIVRLALILWLARQLSLTDVLAILNNYEETSD